MSKQKVTLCEQEGSYVSIYAHRCMKENSRFPGRISVKQRKIFGETVITNTG